MLNGTIQAETVPWNVLWARGLHDEEVDVGFEDGGWTEQRKAIGRNLANKYILLSDD